MKSFEMILIHDGVNWIAKNDVMSFSAPDLETLDSDIERFLKEKEFIKVGEKAEVFIAFDNSTIPQWIRQYTQHYFNRILEIKG